MTIQVPDRLYNRVKWGTIAFAWLCWVSAAAFRNWWLVLLGFVPYLVWNQVVPYSDSETNESN